MTKMINSTGPNPLTWRGQGNVIHFSSASLDIMTEIVTKAENFTDRYYTAHKEEKMWRTQKMSRGGDVKFSYNVIKVEKFVFTFLFVFEINLSP